MKKRILIVFGFVFFINLILLSLPFILDSDKANIKDTMISLIGSSVAYWLVNSQILILKKTGREASSALVGAAWTTITFLFLCIFIIKLKDDIELVRPMAVIIALLANSATWSFFDGKKKK